MESKVEMTMPGDFQQITWDEWVNHYWIPTISLYAPLVFVKACPHSHEGHINGHRKAPHGDQIMTTPFVMGEDGFVYEVYKAAPGQPEELKPIYKIEKYLGDQTDGNP